VRAIKLINVFDATCFTSFAGPVLLRFGILSPSYEALCKESAVLENKYIRGYLIAAMNSDNN